ncbi:MAG: carbon-nitrogen hydrolase family protein [Candidatus Magasanikbacteria bacterium]
MKISYTQFLPNFLELESNIEKVRAILEDNKSQVENSDVFVFPEYFLSGSLNIDFLEEYKQKGGSDYIKKELKQISSQYPDTYFVFGSLVNNKEENYYNTTVVVKKGKILGEYNKKALIYHEQYYLEADNEIFYFKAENDLKVGVAICWDIMYPEIFRKYIGKVDLMVVPSFWGIGGNPLQQKYSIQLEKRYYDSLGVARAYENGTTVLFVNSVGKYESEFYSDRMMGGSYFVHPPKGIIHKNTDKDPYKVYSVEFDKNLLQEYRENYAPEEDFENYKEQGLFL